MGGRPEGPVRADDRRVGKGRLAEQTRHLFAPPTSGAQRPEERRQLSRDRAARARSTGTTGTFRDIWRASSPTAACWARTCCWGPGCG